MLLAQPLPIWVQIIAALLTPIVAVSVGVIAYMQWRTNQNKLKLDLFDRRYATYTALKNFLGSIYRNGDALGEDIHKFSNEVAIAPFVFNDEIGEYLWQLEKRAFEMQMLTSELKETPVGQKRTELVQMRTKHLEWFFEQGKNLSKRFSPFLRLTHQSFIFERFSFKNDLR